MELGRRAPMLTSASPGRGGGDGAGAGRAQRATGSSTTIANSAALTVGRSPALAQRCGSSGSERSAEFGSVNHVRLPSRARARRRRFQRALTPTDLHRPAGRRCGCWPTSTVLVSLAPAGADPAGNETSQMLRSLQPASLYGAWFLVSFDTGWRASSRVIETIANVRSLQPPVYRWLCPLLRSAPRPLGRSERCSGMLAAFIMLRCPHARARGWRRFQRAGNADRPKCRQPAAGQSICLFLFSGIVVGRFGGGRWSSGDRAPMLTSASPGRGGGDGAGAGRAQRATGSSATIGKFCSTDSGALSLARSALRRPRLGKISGIWQR